MAKVKLLTSMAGINFSHNVGDIIEMSDEQAVRFVDAGIAEAVDAPKSKIERAIPKRKFDTAVKKD